MPPAEEYAVPPRSIPPHLRQPMATGATDLRDPEVFEGT